MITPPLPVLLQVPPALLIFSLRLAGFIAFFLLASCGFHLLIGAGAARSQSSC